MFCRPRSICHGEAVFPCIMGPVKGHSSRPPYRSWCWNLVEVGCLPLRSDRAKRHLHDTSHWLIQGQGPHHNSYSWAIDVNSALRNISLSIHDFFPTITYQQFHRDLEWSQLSSPHRHLGFQLTLKTEMGMIPGNPVLSSMELIYHGRTGLWKFQILFLVVIELSVLPWQGIEWRLQRHLANWSQIGGDHANE
jgi:hypothetical protein